MATITPTFNASPSAADGSVVTFNWALTTANNDGAPFQFAEFADITFVVTASNWGGATLKFQGSADGTTFATTTGLSSAAGGAEAAVTTDKCVTIIERPLYIRPILTTAGTAAVVSVTAVCRRATPLRT